MTDSLFAFDAVHIWHPYASLPGPEAFIFATGARGAILTGHDRSGRPGEWIDAMASWWSVIHGYSHPHLVAAAHAQIDSFSHVMFGGITHAPAIALTKRIIELLPTGLDRVFLSDSGSIAVEVAVKIALQYWRSLGRPDRNGLLTWRGGYHGDTYLAMSLCDEGGFHDGSQGRPYPVAWAPTPPSGFSSAVAPDYERALVRAFELHAPQTAAMIIEPVMQGAGGMRFHNPRYVGLVRELCDHHGVLLICDEIATGFGRTGRLLATGWANVAPDIICLGKALTGGMANLAATACSEKVASTIAGGHEPVLAHGPTFMANPLACALAVASIDLLIQSDWEKDIARHEATFTRELAAARQITGVADVRVLGGVAVIETTGPLDIEAATLAAMDAGVWIRPFGRLIYAMPPYCLTEEQLVAVADAMVRACHAGMSRP